MSALCVFKMTNMFVVPTPTWRQALLAGTRDVLRTLGCLKLHTLEVRDMPLGSIAKELVEHGDGWCVRHLDRLERLVLNNCNMDSKATLAVLRSCTNLRELDLQNNFGNEPLDDAAFGVGQSAWYWDRLKPVQLPKLVSLNVWGTKVTPAGVAHLPGVKKLDMRYQATVSQ
jgi:hypothetical protein